MQTSSWITMVVITGIVWGGTVFLVTKALRAEAGKSREQGTGDERQVRRDVNQE